MTAFYSHRRVKEKCAYVHTTAQTYAGLGKFIPHTFLHLHLFIACKRKFHAVFVEIGVDRHQNKPKQRGILKQVFLRGPFSFSFFSHNDERSDSMTGHNFYLEMLPGVEAVLKSSSRKCNIIQALSHIAQHKFRQRRSSRTWWYELSSWCGGLWGTF